MKPRFGLRKISHKTVGRSGMYIVKAEANQVEKIVAISVRAFETDVTAETQRASVPGSADGRSSS